MDRSIYIQQLADFILLNAYSNNSSGLYNGKAGMALALLQAGYAVEKEYLADQAIELLYEALNTEIDDIGFENGLAGIGYVLAYAIHNELIDADFQALFARHHNSIVQKLEETQKSDKKDVPPSWINVAYYLVATQKLLPRHDYEQLFSRILQACEGVIIESLQNIRRGVPSDKASLQRMLVRYLEVAQHTQFFTPSHSILQTYCKLYADAKFVNNFWIGWYLQQITEKQGAYGEVAGQNIEVGLPFLKADNLSLSECVKLLTVLQTWGSHSCCDAKIDELCIKLFPDKGGTHNWQRVVLRSVVPGAVVAGYGEGVARLLLHLAVEDNVAYPCLV